MSCSICRGPFFWDLLVCVCLVFVACSGGRVCDGSRDGGRDMDEVWFWLRIFSFLGWIEVTESIFQVFNSRLQFLVAL